MFPMGGMYPGNFIQFEMEEACVAPLPTFLDFSDLSAANTFLERTRIPVLALGKTASK